MEAIIEKLREELAKIFGTYTADSFVAFVKTSKVVQKTLEKDFESGKNLSVEIIKHSRS